MTTDDVYAAVGYDKNSGEEPNFLQKAVANGYNALMSAGDSALGVMLLGRGYTATMGAGATAQKAQELYERGASDKEITAGALTAGAMETFFEYASLEKIIKMQDGSGLGAFFINALKSAGVEASEEVFTEIGNKAAESYEAEEGYTAVPDGGQWNDRAYSGGQVRTVEGWTAEQGGEGGTGGTAAAAAEKVSSIQLGLTEGTENRNLLRLSEAAYNEDTKVAARVARDNGLEFVAVGGGAIETMVNVNGEMRVVKSRGCVVDGKMFVRVDDSTFTAEQIARHEAAHEQIRKGEIDVEQIRQKLREQYSDAEIDAIVELYASAYGDSGLTAEEVLEEIVCDAEAQMNAFATEQTERIAGEVGLFLRNVGRIANAQKVETIKNTTGNGGVKRSSQMNVKGGQYDYSKPFSQQLEDYKNGIIPAGDTLIVGPTPDVLRGIGLSSLPITINTTHVDYALNGTKDFDHHLGKPLLEQLPKALSNPVAIMTSGTKAGSSLVVMLEIQHNGKQIVVPKVVDGFGYQNGIQIDSNAITSVYGKNNAVSKVLHDAIVQEGKGTFRLYFLDKKKATALLQVAKVPMPKMPATHNGGYVHSLTDAGSPVKMKYGSITQTQQFKRWFGDWQKHPDKASKVVNADGTPKVVYHGTNKDFTVFQSASGMYWFSESKDYAEEMAHERRGKNVIGAYLNIKNPYVAKLPPNQFSNPSYEAGIIRKARAGKHDGIIITNDTTNDLMAETFYVVFDSKQIKSATDNIGTFDGSNPDIRYSREMDTAEALKNTTGNGGGKYSRAFSERRGDGQKITQYMADAERTEILKRKTITAEVYKGQADDSIRAELGNLESGKKQLIKAALTRIGEEFGVFTDYNISDVGIEIKMSISNLRESVAKEINPKQIAKLLPVFKTAVENAVGIEQHSNRYFYDNSTIMFENLIGGYVDDGYFVPVRFGLKHQRQGGASLYLIVDQQKIDLKNIKAEVVKTPGVINTKPNASRSAFGISVADIIPFVNSKDLLRYLPDDLINENQRKAKWNAIAETIKYTNEKNDKKYIEFVRAGNLRAANQMVQTAAEAAGYDKLFYHGSKKGGGFTEFRDWQYFTQSKSYAEQYAERGNGESLYTVYAKTEKPFDTREAKAREIFENARQELEIGELQDNGLPNWTDGYDLSNYIDENDLDYDSIILDEGGEMVHGEPVSHGLSYVIRKSNQVKSADVITYDKNGEIIPISQRFNTEKMDIRYSREMDTVKALERQNKILNKILKERVEYWKDQTRKTKAPTADKASVRRLGREILSSYSSDTQVDEILPELQWLANDAIGKGNASYAELVEASEKVARKVLEGSGVDVNGELAEERQALKKYLRSTPINATEGIKAGIADFGDFKKRNRALHFREDGSGTDVDKMWLELQDRFGTGMFPEDVMNPEDQVRYIADKVAAMAEDIQNPYQKDMEFAVQQLTYDILFQTTMVEQKKPTRADKAVEKATEEMRKLLEKGRQRENDRIVKAQKAESLQKIRTISDQFQRMATRPGKGISQHAPEKLRRAVVDFCSIFTESELRRMDRWGKSLEYRAELLGSMGVNIHIFQSRLGTDGKPVGENGSYHMADGSIHIDLNAGADGQGVMAYTISHELTHFMEDQQPAQFQRFSDALFEDLDTEVEAEIARKAEALKRQLPEQYKDAGNDKLMEDARSEVVAEACETMLTDTDAARQIAQRIQAQDASLWEKIVQWFKDFEQKLRSAYNGLKPGSGIAKDAKKTLQQVDGLVKMWADMAVDSAENYREGEGNENSAMIDTRQYSFRNTISGMANDALLPYDSEMTSIIKTRGDIIVDSYAALQNVVDDAFDNPSKKATVYFGILDSKSVERIEKKVPNIPSALDGKLFKMGKSYSIAATLDSIRHLSDNKSLSREDVLDYLDRMPDTIVDNDSVNFDYYTDS